MSQSIISSNYAYFNGGAIELDQTLFTLIESSISNNTAHAGNGGGIYASSYKVNTVTLLNCTIANNTAKRMSFLYIFIFYAYFLQYKEEELG